MFEKTPQEILRSWAEAYRRGPRAFRFPADPGADFFPQDMEAAATEIDRLRAALESLTVDPPPTLDEPDEDWEVVVKMRAIAREALDAGLPTAEDVRGILCPEQTQKG